MNDPDLLQAIKANQSWKKLADAGSDDELAQSITITLPKSVPITASALQQAAPNTLGAIASGQNPLSEMEVIASRIRAGDWSGVGSWATTLHMLAKMSDAELAAVERLIAGTSGDSVDHVQVSRVLAPFRTLKSDITEVIDGVAVVHQTAGTVVAQPINWSSV